MAFILFRQLFRAFLLTLAICGAAGLEARGDEAIIMRDSASKKMDSSWEPYLGIENMLATSLGYYSVGFSSIRFGASYLFKESPWVVDLGMGLMMLDRAYYYGETALRYRLSNDWQAGVVYRRYEWEQFYGFQLVKEISKNVSIGIAPMMSSLNQATFMGLDIKFTF